MFIYERPVVRKNNLKTSNKIVNMLNKENSIKFKILKINHSLDAVLNPLNCCNFK